MRNAPAPQVGSVGTSYTSKGVVGKVSIGTEQK